VIINPDKKLGHDSSILIEPSLFKAPLHNPIRQAQIDMDLERLRQQQIDLLRKAEECFAREAQKKQMGDVPQEPGSESCGVDDSLPSALEIFENINRNINQSL
ncbi:MAG: hypothetical protein AAF549_06075, partial [Pseudomonadota bacterium]